MTGVRIGLRDILWGLSLVAALQVSRVVLFTPAETAAADLHRDAAAKRGALLTSQAGRQELVSVEQSARVLDAALVSFESEIPAEAELPKVVNAASTTAEANSLDVASVGVIRTRPAGDFTEAWVQFRVSGHFNGLYAFLLQAERLRGVRRVERLCVRPGKEPGAQAEATVVLGVCYRALADGSVPTGLSSVAEAADDE